jgi:ABC-type branched-subunit amino acid transport system permease subunit
MRMDDDNTLYSLRQRWNNQSRLRRRLIIATVVAFDAILGLLYQNGLGNGIDWILAGNLPNDLVWISQSLQLISMGFMLVKIVFDDLQQGWVRTSLMVFSPLFLLLVVLFTIELLMLGLDKSATIYFNFTSIGFSTLTWSSTYLAIAVGCTLTYSVQRYGNFAQSEFFMLGMYVAVMMMWMDFFYPLHATPKDGVIVWSVLIWTLVGAFILTGIAGIVIDRLVFRGFRKRKSHQDVMMIASLGVALILRAIVYLRFGAGTKLFEPDVDWRIAREQRFEAPTMLTKLNLGDRSLESGESYNYGACEQVGVDETGAPVLEKITTEGSKPLADVYSVGGDCVTELTSNYTYYSAAMPFVIFGSVALLLLLLTKTRLGRRMRAVADNPELAASSGINVERVHMTSAFLSAGISGIGGAIFAMTIRFSPETGFTLLLPAFAVIVLGTIGSVQGAIVGALIIGFVRSVSSPILMGIGTPLERSNYSNLAEVMPYVLIIAILLIMPKGIGDAYDQWNIRRIRMRAEKAFESKPKRAAWLGVFFAPIGIHHFSNRQSQRGQKYLISTIIAYIVYKFSSFVRDHSIANSTIFDTLTGGDSKISIAHAPASLTVAQQEHWLWMMEAEQLLVGFLSNIGFILWPGIPILLYLFAWREAYYVLSEKEMKKNERLIAMQSSLSKSWVGITTSISQVIHLVQIQVDQKTEFISKNINQTVSKFKDDISESIASKRDATLKRLNMPYGRESERGSWYLFTILALIMAGLIYWLPVADGEQATFVKSLQLSNVLVTLSIFGILAMSLNLHTGITGQLNFGVIFFASIGAITVGLLTAPKELHGYDWPIVYAVMFAMALGALAGWLLAYPTARLRSDYFAIITISLGEIVRVLLSGEPLLRAGSWGSAVGISRYKLPLQEWWFCGSETPVNADGVALSPVECSKNVEEYNIESMAVSVGEFFNLGEPAPYLMVLAFIGIVGLLITWWLLNTILASPWGRILRSIREDEMVAQHHGHDILRHKAASLALGAAIAAFAGALWAWKLNGFQPTFMSPSKTTFLVWAAFIIGGMGNNRGMLIGASIIVLMEFVFNVLVAAQGTSDLPLNELAADIDRLFNWFVTQTHEAMWICFTIMLIAYLLRWTRISETFMWYGVVFALALFFFDERSINEVFMIGTTLEIESNMAYVKVMLVGLLLVLSLQFNSKGLLPEVPYRPPHPEKEVEEQ